MKARETATRIMDILQAVKKVPEERRYEVLTAQLLTLVSHLLAVEPGYGHAARIHKLTGGNDNGNDRKDQQP